MVQNVAGSGLRWRSRFAIRRLENSVFQPSGKWVPFRREGKGKAVKERDGFRYHQLCPRYCEHLTPTVSTAIGVWVPFTFTFFYPREAPGRVAQSVRHSTHKSEVLGAIPGLATYFRVSFRFFKKGSCQLLAKVCARSTG